jgi:hypothetical protein
MTLKSAPFFPKSIFIVLALAFVAFIFALAASPARAEDNTVEVISGDVSIYKNAAIVVCSDDEDATSRFWSELKVRVPKYRFYYLKTATEAYETVRKERPDVALAVKHRDDPKNTISRFCIAVSTPAKTENTQPSKYVSVPRRVDISEVNETTEAQDGKSTREMSPLEQWSSALTELHAVARQFATSSDLSRATKAALEDDISEIQNILDHGAKASQGSTALIGSDGIFEDWGSALKELRTAAKTVTQPGNKISKKIINGMKDDLKELRKELNREPKDSSFLDRLRERRRYRYYR